MGNNKKRDSKGRILLEGESQRNDGRYEYRYTDNNGKRRSVYSYRLTASDRMPDGCRARNTEPLRDLEARIRRDIEDGIDTQTARTMTLNQAFKKNMASRMLKESTRENYTYMYSKYIAPEFGDRLIDDIRYSDMKLFYSMLMNDGFKANSIESIHTILSPVFSDAVRDGVIRTNPTKDLMLDIKKRSDWVKTHRDALTLPQQQILLKFIRNSNFSKWYNLIVFFLGTGCRASEGIGIRWEDINLKDNTISINHNAIYRRRLETGECEVYITTPKTRSGVRTIPLLPEVRDALYREREYQKQCYIQCTDDFDGYTGFVFCNRFGHIHRPTTINRAIQRIINAYNQSETSNARDEHREPVLLPHFSLHNLRHTFCTRLCENESNIKVIQEIMGHADSQTTLDIYAEVTREAKVKFFDSIANKIRLTGESDAKRDAKKSTDATNDAN